jgi:hypothetical protein
VNPAGDPVGPPAAAAGPACPAATARAAAAIAETAASFLHRGQLFAFIWFLSLPPLSAATDTSYSGIWWKRSQMTPIAGND